MMSDADDQLKQDLKRAEEFQAVAPQEKQNQPEDSSKTKEKTEQEKVAQAAKVAQWSLY